MTKILNSEHCVNRLSFLLRQTRADPDSLEAYKFASEYLTAMIKALAATDDVIFRKVKQRVRTIEEILDKREPKIHNDTK